jgi:HSP20 family molecular chaperone IbpA
MKSGMISEELIRSIDVANTLQGGITEPLLKLTQYRGYFKIDLKVAGVEENKMHVKINNNQLIVFFERSIVSNGEVVNFPYVVYNRPIPYFIDAKKIRAQFNEGTLSVRLPFNELANGFHRDVPIDI